jgi:hypothetical protein
MSDRRCVEASFSKTRGIKTLELGGVLHANQVIEGGMETFDFILTQATWRDFNGVRTVRSAMPNFLSERSYRSPDLRPNDTVYWLKSGVWIMFRLWGNYGHRRLEIDPDFSRPRNRSRGRSSEILGFHACTLIVDRNFRILQARKRHARMGDPILDLFIVG